MCCRTQLLGTDTGEVMKHCSELRCTQFGFASLILSCAEIGFALSRGPKGSEGDPEGIFLTLNTYQETIISDISW